MTTEQWVQARSEHIVSHLNPWPHYGCVDVDLSGLGGVTVSVPGPSLFAFTRDQHVEVQFEDAAQLRHCVAALMAASTRRREITREDTRAYAARKISDVDAEWMAAMKQKPNWKKEFEKKPQAVKP